MGSLIDISAPQYQLRANRNLWALVGGIGSVAGLLVWSASPFALHNSKDKVQVCLRYLSLVATLSSGVAVVAAGSQLQRISPLIRAVEMAEKQDFLSQLAASQYQQEQHWNAAATQPYQTQLQQPTQLQELTAPPLPPAADYRQLFLAVKVLREAGVEDAKIIKDILQVSDQDGKVILAALLQLGQQQGW